MQHDATKLLKRLIVCLKRKLYARCARARAYVRIFVLFWCNAPLVFEVAEAAAAAAAAVAQVATL